MRACLLALFLLLASCGPNSAEDFLNEADGIKRKIASELKQIHTRDELAKAVPKLRKEFNELVAVIIAARTFHDQSEKPLDPEISDVSASQQLLAELKRVYKIEAGRQLIEQAQQEALLKLDAYEQRKR